MQQFWVRSAEVFTNFTTVIVMFITFCFLLSSAGIAENVPEYVIGQGDVIQVSVWQYDQFNTTSTVGPDGKITMPMLGDITIAGFTREEVKRDITEKLSKFVKEGAEVTVSIVQFQSQRISIFGQVNNPRTLAFSLPPSLIEVMVTAVPLPDADLTAVKIIPGDPSVRKPITVNMLDFLQEGDPTQLPKLRSGDTIYVPRIETTDDETATEGTTGAPSQAIGEGLATPRQTPDAETQAAQFVVHVMGSVTTPSSYAFVREPTLTEVLLQAGSVIDHTALKYVRIIRGGPTGGDKVLHVDLEKYLAEGDASLLPRLYSGDTIYVPDVTQEKLKDVSIIVTGQVLTPGAYKTQEPLSILDAISLAGGLTPDADTEMIRIMKETPDSYQEKIVNIDEFLEDVGSTTPPEMVGPGHRIYVPMKRRSGTRAAVAVRDVVVFLADLVSVYSVYRLITE